MFSPAAGTVSGGGATGGPDLSISAKITNGGLTKAGAGILELTGNNDYTGGTIVNAGTLLANNTSGSGTGTGSVTVNSTGTLGGTGTAGTDAPDARDLSLDRYRAGAC